MRFKYFLVFSIILLAHVGAGVWYSGYAWWWTLITLLFLLGILVLGCMNIRWNFFLRSTNRVPLSIQQLRTGTNLFPITSYNVPN